MKAILVFSEMPKSCDECEVRCGGYTAKEYSEKSIKRPSWCPLKPIPEKIEEGEEPNIKYGISEYAVGRNDVIDEILGETE